MDDLTREQERILANALARAAMILREEAGNCLHCNKPLSSARRKLGLDLCLECADQRARLDEIAGVRQ
jgi:hypothetical protein